MFMKLFALGPFEPEMKSNWRKLSLAISFVYLFIYSFFSLENSFSEYVPSDPRELANRIFVTCYMGSENSSEETRKRAACLAEEIGSYHMGK